MFDEETWPFAIQADTQTTNLSYSISKIINIWDINANKFVTDYASHKGLLHKKSHERFCLIIFHDKFNKIERGRILEKGIIG